MKNWRFRSGVLTIIAFTAAVLPTGSRADVCGSEQRMRAGLSKEVEYTARVVHPGYRFSMDGLSWEIVQTQFADATGRSRFVVTHPALIDPDSSPASRDFFVSLQVTDNPGIACNDVLFRDDNPVHRLRVNDDSDSQILFGDLDKREKRLESTRKLATELRVRSGGSELLIATGFATRRSLNISACASGFDDSFGFVEYQTGHVQLTCFPADPDSQDYVDEIDWHVDYQWPENPPALLDRLIDYVYVEAVEGDS
jgi:hypothetical protein